jgi:putative transposase
LTLFSPFDYKGAMPRIARSAAGGLAYHVINRGNGRRTVFHKDADYEAFLKAMAHACVEVPMPVLGYCLMPNHFHLVLLPRADGDLSRWMHWLLNAHVRRYHKQHESSGHVWQGRYKSFPIEADDHLLTVLRYVERNPVRAGLVKRAELWNWSSAREWPMPEERPSFLVPGPVERPADWLKWVNKALTPVELEVLRRSVNRGAPYGDAGWSAATATKLGLESTLRPRGRPRKTPVKSANGKIGT